jgi:1-acyl-sn-glycerol-3-phosphate acyltransferase
VRLPLLTRIAATLARFGLSSLARVRLEVQGELPQSGPLIVVANHMSNADPPLVAGWLTPRLGRQMHILAKEALFVGPIGAVLRRLGATMLATRSGVAILPVGVSGTDRFLGRSQKLPRIGARITVRVGEPFTVGLDPAKPRRVAMQDASDEIMRRVAALVDERHRGRFAPS